VAVVVSSKIEAVLIARLNEIVKVKTSGPQVVPGFYIHIPAFGDIIYTVSVSTDSN